ncbi:LOW QUALITY PROTEIN: hypothetical protein CFOL_v3_00450, partial [Cephalotus follicularis]
EKGYTVHATLRNLGDSSKVDLIKSLPDADSRLVLFQADIDTANESKQFKAVTLFSMLQHTESNHVILYLTHISAIAGANAIAMSCVRSRTVKRLIYTASVAATSPMKDDGSGFKDLVDETCWTPLHVPFPYSSDHLEVLKNFSKLSPLSFGPN